MSLLALAAAVCLVGAFLLLTPSRPTATRRTSRRPSVGAAVVPVRLLRGPRRDQRDELTDVATACRELSVLLGAGLPPSTAWTEVARSAGPVTSAAAAAAATSAKQGGDVAAALRGAAPTGVAGAAVHGLASTWYVTDRTGAPVADVLARYADVLQDEVDDQDAVRAAMAAPRATVRVLLALPPAGLLLGAVAGADPVAVLLGTSLGRVSGVAGAALAGIGWLWTRRMLAAVRLGVP